MTVHPWDAVRAVPTVVENTHESVFRAFHILREVERMLERGDSTETIHTFVRWAQDRRL